MKKPDLKKFLKDKNTVALAVLGAAFLGFGATWAFYSSNHTALANPLSTTHSGAAMVEEFNPNSSFLPGETVAKKVAFQNTGDMALFLRVEIPPEEGWYDSKNAEMLVNELETKWVIKNWTEAWSDDGASGKGQWSEVFTDAETGKTYRYYERILPVKAQTDCILDSITLDPAVSNDRHYLDYSDKIYKLTFNAEAVPVEGDDNHPGVQAEWRMSVVKAADGTLTWTQN